MPIVVDVEDLAAAEFLLMLSSTSKTGKLSAVRSGHKILLGLKDGSVVYAAQPAVRERLGSVLINRGLILEDDLYRALEIQREESGSRLLGTILVDIGAISDEGLREVIRSQFETVIRELMSWDRGVMVFNRVDMADLEAIKIDPSEVILGAGIETDTLLAENLARLDAIPRRPDPVPPPAPKPAPPQPTAADMDSVAAALAEITASVAEGNGSSVASMLAEGDSLSVSLTAEMTLAILGAASEVASRGLLVLVYPDVFSGIGGFGDAGEGRQITGQGIRIPRHLPSVLLSVAEGRQAYRGPLSMLGGNLNLVADLGDSPSGDVVVVPLIVRGAAVAVLYADAGADGGGVGATTTLEGVVAEVGRSLESAAS